MEVDKLVSALHETLAFLRDSRSSDKISVPVDEVIRRLEAEVAKAKNEKPVDVILLDRFFAPTGVIQKISIENGWGTRFLRLSEVVDQFTRYAP